MRAQRGAELPVEQSIACPSVHAGLRRRAANGRAAAAEQWTSSWGWACAAPFSNLLGGGKEEQEVSCPDMGA